MKRQIIRLTETDLHHIINESVKKVINEVQGWSLEKDDITWVNDDENGYGKPWMVRLWTGSGYFLPAFAAYANSEEDALEKVVAYLEKQENDDFFADEYVEQQRDELREEGMDDEEIENEIDNSFLYVDATMDGAEKPHYVWVENLSIYPYDEDSFA